MTFISFSVIHIFLTDFAAEKAVREALVLRLEIVNMHSGPILGTAGGFRHDSIIYIETIAARKSHIW